MRKDNFFIRAVIPFLVSMPVICFSMACDVNASEMPKEKEEAKEEVTQWPFSDMVLCYGGSAHRKPFQWDKERFSAYVSCEDAEGKEQWLFDGFLFLEFCNLNRGDGMYWSYCTGYSAGHNRSAGRDLWQEQIDYWFAEGCGFNALEEAVAETAKRIGKPSHKRKVVLSIPDPILHKQYDDLSSPTQYWGELDGRQLDFANPQDRADACKWFADEVVKRFRKSHFKYIELDGFYKISEEITTPDEGWCYDMKKMDLFLPILTDYLHKKGYKYYWIPYRKAAGYDKGAKFGVDFTWMQPNYFWHADKYPFDQSMRWILDAGIGMELEMDKALLEGKENAELYRMRFRKYLENAKRYQIYGKFPFTYYIETDAFRMLRKSEHPEDIRMYEEFRDFILNNPVREICK